MILVQVQRCKWFRWLLHGCGCKRGRKQEERQEHTQKKRDDKKKQDDKEKKKVSCMLPPAWWSLMGAVVAQLEDLVRDTQGLLSYACCLRVYIPSTTDAWCAYLASGSSWHTHHLRSGRSWALLCAA